jgi:hypothetical protein
MARTKQTAQKKQPKLNADGTPKVKMMLAGRNGQRKAGKTHAQHQAAAAAAAQPIVPGTEADWMNLLPLECPVSGCTQTFPIGKRATRQKLLYKHLHSTKTEEHRAFREMDHTGTGAVIVSRTGFSWI